MNRDTIYYKQVQLLIQYIKLTNSSLRLGWCLGWQRHGPLLVREQS